MFIPPAVQPPAVVYSAFGNLTRGDCQSTAIGNIVQTIDPSAFVTQASIDALYRQFQRNPTDANYFADLIAPYWRRHAVGGYRLRSYHEIRPTGKWETFALSQRTEIKTELARHHALYATALIPSEDGAITGPWTLANSPDEGTFAHAFAVVGYSSGYLDIVTWGAVQRVTWAWLSTYATALFSTTLSTTNLPKSLHSAVLNP